MCSPLIIERWGNSQKDYPADGFEAEADGLVLFEAAGFRCLAPFSAVPLTSYSPEQRSGARAECPSYAKMQHTPSLPFCLFKKVVVLTS
jgi:hypothetical protein